MVRPGPLRKQASESRLRQRVEGRAYKPEEIQRLLDQLEARVAQLRNSQEQFFLGIDRKPPDVQRKALKRELDEARLIVGRNTGYKFRANALLNRFLAYERMWLRTERDIEEGRYHRDLFKARLRAQQPPSEQHGEAPIERSPLAPVPSPPAPQSGPSDGRLRAVYEAYVTAKRQCNEPIAGLSFEQVASRLRQQVPGLLEQTKAKAIDFKVVIKDGRATLRAIAKL